MSTKLLKPANEVLFSKRDINVQMERARKGVQKKE